MGTDQNDNESFIARSAKSALEADISHLGVLIGPPDADRIIAVSTSTVFVDKSLAKTFWGVTHTAIDSGFQGHMYTRPNDILVVTVPHSNKVASRMVVTAIDANYNLWKSLTGIELASAVSRIVVASPLPEPPPGDLPKTVTWYTGSLLDAALARHQNNGETLLAFVLDNHLEHALELRRRDYPILAEQAQTTSLLMDKNRAMQVLQKNGVDCASTYAIDAETHVDDVLNSLPSAQRYVFKPAGGAAGVGVFSNNGRGAELSLLRNHINILRRNNQLPNRFQIQEFIPGIPLGATGSFGTNGAFNIFEIHQQLIDDAAGFVGARWTPIGQAEQLEAVTKLYRQLAAIRQPIFRGLICLDIIDGQIIEVNPRLTAAAPIAHVLRRQFQFALRYGSGFRIGQIDLNTELSIPYQAIQDGRLGRLTNSIWNERGVLILPQGLNPFGKSRVLFINDDAVGTAQQTFIHEISR